MPYAATLDRLIKESGMTAKDIAERCKEYGVDVTPSYISLLRNPDKKRVASDDVSIALAKVLGQPDDSLVIERYFDEAPAQIKNAIINFYRVTYSLAITITGEQLPPFELLIDKLPMAELIYSLSEFNVDSLDTEIFEKVSSKESLKMNYLPELRVSDNGLAPVIKQGDFVKVGAITKFTDGDTIALGRDSEAICRQYRIIDDKPFLVSFNTDYPSIAFDDECNPIGVVKSLITAI